jgi:hypothetical protein
MLSASPLFFPASRTITVEIRFLDVLDFLKGTA